jgi:putative transcriptional regulator
MLDLSFTNQKEARSGILLISDPFLKEEYFRRSVVLVCEHDENGTFGFVLNHYLEDDLHHIDNQFPDIQARVSIGGPVDTTNLFYIHSFSDIEHSFEILDGLYFGGNYEQIQELLINDETARQSIRFFIGYSGWAAGQLSDELSENGWLVADNISRTEILSTSDDDFWKHCLEKQGERFKIIANFTINPEKN